MNLNIDRWAAQTAQKITQGTNDAKKLFSLLNKALGVLQSQGVYACMLYLYAENDQKNASVVRKALWGLLERLEKEAKVEWPNGFELPKNVDLGAKEFRTQQQVLQFYSDAIAADLDTLLLVRDLYEQTLIYARYHAKALGGEEK